MVGKGVTPVKVVEVAAGIADRNGFDRLTLADVAHALTIRVPSLYKHIGGLEDLRDRIAVLASTQLQEQLVTAVGERTGAAAFTTWARAYRAFVSGHPGMYYAMIRQPGSLLPIPEMVVGSTLLPRILTECGVPAERLDPALVATRSLLRGFVLLDLSGRSAVVPEQVDGDEVDEAFDRVLDLALDMMPGTRRTPLVRR